MHFNLKDLLCIFMILEPFWIIAKADYSSALVDLEPLLYTDAEIVNALDTYLELEEKRLEQIKRYRDEYHKLYKTATRDLKIFLTNPVNAFLLVKRLTMDWTNVFSLLNLSSSKDFVETAVQNEVFPNDYDLDECADALLRLQDTYLLNTTQLSKGEIAEIRGTSELLASDCFVIGLHAYTEENFSFALHWLQEALDRLEKDWNESVNKSILLEMMAYSTYSLGNPEHALNLTKDLLEVNPDHSKAWQNLIFYAKKLKDLEENKDENEKLTITDETENKTEIEQIDLQTRIKATDTYDFDRYKKLCRGDRLRSPAEESKLSCRYTTSNSKYFLLQPIKEEVLNLDPKIVIYHDVIRDKDIQFLKEMSGHLLERASVFDPDTGLGEYAKYRISKSGWLADVEHPRIRHISLMIKEVTGLEVDTAENLQVNKYGIGGHYMTHYDFSREGEGDPFHELGTGNRIATWMFYLSDVDAGGSTVFPHIDVQAKPVKGSAVFWFNLLKSGEGDLRTAHGGCPVLAGTKWVANKWLHERGQEFRRTCSLNKLE